MKKTILIALLIVLILFSFGCGSDAKVTTQEPVKQNTGNSNLVGKWIVQEAYQNEAPMTNIVSGWLEMKSDKSWSNEYLDVNGVANGGKGTYSSNQTNIEFLTDTGYFSTPKYEVKGNTLTIYYANNQRVIYEK